MELLVGTGAVIVVSELREVFCGNDPEFADFGKRVNLGETIARVPAGGRTSVHVAA